MSRPPLSLQKALDMVLAAETDAQTRGLKPVSIVVLAADGTVIASVSQNGASAFRFEVARAKAHGALQMGRHSRELEAMATERPALVSSLLQVEGARIVLAAGGVLISNGRVLIGALGVSGDTSATAAACALIASDQVCRFASGRALN